MELYQSGSDSNLIQMFKWALESWEYIEKTPCSTPFYNHSDIFSKLGLSLGRNFE